MDELTHVINVPCGIVTERKVWHNGERISWVRTAHFASIPVTESEAKAYVASLKKQE